MFLYFDETYKHKQLDTNDQSSTIEFDDKCYQEMIAAFEREKIKPKILIFRFVPGQETLYLPQSLNLSNECKEEIEVRSLPLFIYDEMLPVL